MVGSRQGWIEVPYVQCPAGLAEIAAAMREVRWGERRAWIVPGLSCRDAAGRSTRVHILDTRALEPDAAARALFRLGVMLRA